VFEGSLDETEHHLGPSANAVAEITSERNKIDDLRIESPEESNDTAEQTLDICL
jgi:hypothetical protein